MKNIVRIILFLISFLYHTIIFSAPGYKKKEINNLVLIIAAPLSQEDFSKDSQGIQAPEEEEEKCQYFLTTGMENDDFIKLNHGDDRGYTHGHLTSITKSCDSGEDVIFSLDSRLFTKFSHPEFPSPDRVLLAFLFVEENRLTIEYTDRRNFKKPYKTMGLLIGHLSRDKLRFAGKEQKAFHEVFENVRIIEYDQIQKIRAGDKQMERRAFFGEIFEYTYSDEDRNSTFVGGKVAFGKSYSLGDLEEICDSYCVDYFRAEAGIELISIDKASNVYVLLEINKALPQPIDAVSIYASIRAQKHESADGLYRESSVGLKFDLFGYQLQYLLKARNLLSEEDRFIEYDGDEDVLMFLGMTIPF